MKTKTQLIEEVKNLYGHDSFQGFDFACNHMNLDIGIRVYLEKYIKELTKKELQVLLEKAKQEGYRGDELK